MKRSPVKITEAYIQSVIDHVVANGLPKTTLSDNEVPGLRIVIQPSGSTAYHAQYDAPYKRPYIKIGDYGVMKLTTARQLMRTIRTLVSNGIDPFDRLQENRVQELLKAGTKWRPPAKR